MAHIILLGCITDMMGNATEGALYDLTVVIEALDEVLQGAIPPERETAINSLFEEMQTFYCEGASSEMGAAAQTQDYITRGNALL